MTPAHSNTTETQRASEPAAPAAAFVGWFCIALAVALAALVLLREWPLSQATLLDPHRRWAMLVMPSDEVTALKLQHAYEAPVYDVGLFGNSRIMMIGAEELGLPGRRIFNFAIGGQSVRQSIRMLEALQAVGKAPHTAIISMDHVELGMPGGAGVLPRPPRRWLVAADDVRRAWSHQGLHGAAVQAINSVVAEADSAAITFNRIYVFDKLRALAGLTGSLTGFRIDGSKKQPKPPNSIDLSPLPKRADTYPQLESDFARLAAVRDAGVKVIVYESPLAPGLADSIEKQLSANARQVRRRFHEACARLHLICYGPPTLSDRPWSDRSHAPAQSLASWLRKLIQ